MQHKTFEKVVNFVWEQIEEVGDSYVLDLPQSLLKKMEEHEIKALNHVMNGNYGYKQEFRYAFESELQKVFS